MLTQRFPLKLGKFLLKLRKEIRYRKSTQIAIHSLQFEKKLPYHKSPSDQAIWAIFIWSEIVWKGQYVSWKQLTLIRPS